MDLTRKDPTNSPKGFFMTTANQTAHNSLSALTEVEQRRINHGVLLQALREIIHAASAGTQLKPERAAEIALLAADDIAKDIRMVKAIREMLNVLSSSNKLTMGRMDQILDLADSPAPIEAVLCNDETSSDEELAEFLVRRFTMRTVEAVEHVKRREHLQRYLMPVAART